MRPRYHCIWLHTILGTSYLWEMPTLCLSLCICRQPVSRLCLLWWNTFSNSLTWRIQKVFTLRWMGSTSSWRKQDMSSGIWKQPSTLVITWLLHMVMNDFLPNLYSFEHALARYACGCLYICVVSSRVLQCTDDSQCGWWENHPTGDTHLPVPCLNFLLVRTHLLKPL